MTAAVVQEVWSGRDGENTSRRERNYTRVFQVLVDRPTLGWEAVRLATGIPRPWESYLSASGFVDLASFCHSVQGRQKQEDPYLWDVTARYSNQIDRPDINNIENPLLRPADIAYDSAPVMVPVWYDRDGSPVVNSADQSFDPPVEEEEQRLVIQITRNQVLYDAVGYLAYYNSVNQDPFFGFPPGMVLCKKITGRRQYENGVFYWPTTFEFNVRLNRDENVPVEDTWAFKILDQGWYEKTLGGKLKLMTDAFGRPLTAPRLLDGGGQPLPSGGTPVFRRFNTKRKKLFGNLLLF